MTCCREPGEILVVPSEGGFGQYLEESPAELTFSNVVSSMDNLLLTERDDREEGLFDPKAIQRLARPFVVEVPEDELEDRVAFLRKDKRLAAVVPNWHLSLRGEPATAEETAQFIDRAGVVFSWLGPGPGTRPVRVAILDSGVDAGVVCCDALDAVQLDTTGGPAGLRGAPTDDAGHGSTVARIIHLVSPEAHIVSIRCFAAGRGRLADIVYGLLIAGTLRELPDIYNMSFSIDAGVELCPYCKKALFGIDQHRAIQQLFEHLHTQLDDIPLLVAAAGNERGPVAIPAALDGVLGVGSNGDGSTPTPTPAYVNDVPPDFVLAPGGTEAIPVGAGTGMHPVALFGTSFSTALVTGLLAKIVARGDELGLPYPHDTQHRSAALSVLAQLADDRFPGYDPRVHGRGVLGEIGL